MVFPKKIYFHHSQNRMNNEGNILAAREYFFKKKNKNLFYLLKNRFSWINNFIIDEDNIIELGCGPAFVKEFINNKNFKTSDIMKDNFIDLKGIDAINTGFADNSYVTKEQAYKESLVKMVLRRQKRLRLIEGLYK